MEQSETYFTLAESRKATCFSDIRDNIGVVLYSAETARKEEEDAGAIFVKEDLPGGMVMVIIICLSTQRWSSTRSLTSGT